MRWLLEIRTDILMARGAEFLLAETYHGVGAMTDPFQLLLVVRMSVVALRACDTRCHMFALAHMALITCLLVAAQTYFRSFLGREICKGTHGLLAAAGLQMVRRFSVTCFTCKGIGMHCPRMGGVVE